MKRFMKANKNKEEEGCGRCSRRGRRWRCLFQRFRIESKHKKPTNPTESIDKFMHSGRPEQIIYMVMIK